ncbi:MAG: VCBS repeat-containing protein, partial [Candidatus Peribacteraceae bacterium]|nr:VCBS repeat-containing protein [Candidatus Peribacteraceae bacterium]
MHAWKKVLSNILILLFCVLVVQFIAKVYAAAYTLSSSTTETELTYDILLADLDGDGDLDELAGNSVSGPDTHDPYANDGAGIFAHQGGVGDAEGFTTVSAGDIDGDGDIDFVQGSTVVTGFMKVYKNLGNFNFTLSTSVGTTPDVPFFTKIFDADNDGDMDIIVGPTTASSQLMYRNDGHGNLTNVPSTLPSTKTTFGQDFVVADFTSDGYQDLGFVTSAGRLSIYKNSGTGAFIETFGVSTTLRSAMAGGDFDGDGDLDIVVANASNQMLAYLNNGNGTSFTAGTATASGLSGILHMASGDVDNDGDLDVILASGFWGEGVKIFVNDGSGVFSSSGSPTETSDYTYGIAIGDIDGDGDLDYVRGNANDPGGEANRRYKNDQALTLPNTAPTAPSSLTATHVSDDGSTATVRLSWGSGSDTETATRMLQYQLRVGTGASAHNIVSGRTASPNWVNRVMPNGQSRTYLLNNIPCNDTYYWNVATVDTGFMSTWGTETTFDLSGSCALTTGGGSSTPDTGGGLPAWFFRQGQNKKPMPEEVLNGTITVSAFKDINRNGHHDPRELTGFAGLPVTASGRTIDDTIMRVTQNLDQNGETMFSLPPSDSRGYWILVATGSEILRTFEPTTETQTGTSILKPNGTYSLSFGFVPDTLVRYVPCMDIGEPTSTPPSDTEAGKLLVRLEDSFGRPILRGISLTGSLIDRRNFFMALQRTQCLPLETNAEKLA